MKGLASSLAVIWRLAAPHFRSEDRRAGLSLLAAVIAIELAIVAITVLINRWNARFYDALQNRNWDSFVAELMYFSVLAGAFIVLAVYQLYLRQWLQIRWRAWMTRAYLGDWLDGANHYRMQLLGDAADNPDQRIADDIRLFVDNGLFIALRLLGAVVSFFSFVVILWTLSAEAPFHLFGVEIAIPGYLVWAALVYAVAGTALTHWIGAPLIGLNFRQQRYEADFRFDLVRTRENAEQIALLSGEQAEVHRLLGRFARVIDNWWAIMIRTKRLTFLTAGYSQAAVVFPFLMISPAYFAGRVQLGGLMQTASAFGSVQEALSVIIMVYRDIAEWRAVIDRLSGFNRAMAAGRTAVTAEPSVKMRTWPHGDAIALDGLVATLPSGIPLVAADDIVFGKGDRALVTGPSGSGKSTLFRAIAGIWPFGSGAVERPADGNLMMLPQRPYFPIGSLHAAITYPALPERFGAEAVAEVLAAVGLPLLAPRLAEEAHWNRLLSLGEQQRLAIARAILHAPRFLFLDEATASLDEPSEEALYRLMQERLAGTTLVSIGHRSTLTRFHRRGFALEHDGELHRLREREVPAP
ncbi:ABC transporter ATP-binding protein/permease [Xanthobacteraceae bacterium Astr-EGSB]|uniref:ABC transporter ATP-binding protein/permease n=1 Tax=Astrobacterium formosum TaxID=3069710 RepID=UPI0027B1E439|nr:ABC transporter ATP-binding protein/permease [Xanthobacteraceae bacterium Astr-EGSB]